jgi:hypothetical protein
VKKKSKHSDLKLKLDKDTKTSAILDFAIISLICQKFKLISLLEVGVFQGAFIKNYLLNVPDSSAVGIDPYPNNFGAKETLLDLINEYNFNEFFNLLEHYDYLKEDQTFDVIHIDGEHSEKAVFDDLMRCLKGLKINSILIIDDVWHPKFPGVVSGFFKFFHSTDLECFLISRNKIYICNPIFFELYRNIALDICHKLKIQVSPYINYFSDGTNYGQSTSIKTKFPVTVLDNKPNLRTLFILKKYQNFLLRIFTYLLPPIFEILLRKSKKLFYER